MISRRNWLFRLSIVLNIVVLCYVATQHMVTYDSFPQQQLLAAIVTDDLQTPGRNLASIEYNTVEGSNPTPQVAAADKTVVPTSNNKIAEEAASEDSVPSSLLIRSKSTTIVGSGSGNSGSGMGPVISVPSSSAGTTPSASPEVSVPNSENVVDWCVDRETHPRTAQRGDYWVLYNYVRAARTFRCHESITYTTHADYTFLDNLEPLVERWQGPISLALFAPGDDFAPTLATIQYLRACGSELISDLVTFHIYFNNKHTPKVIPRDFDTMTTPVNCSKPGPWADVQPSGLYKTQKKLLYPVNVGRNIARETAATHYILPSDIELYPSPGVIPNFLEMVRRNDVQLQRPAPKVFPLSIFELEADAPIPDNKTQLVSMLRSGKAIPFHKKVCAGCHNVPRAKEWQQAKETAGLHIFHIGKRVGYYVHWEPIFIGTHDDPLYDERLSWEGKSDKMTQGYALCVLDYEFQILDNAFLVHKPGIKTVKKDAARAALAAKTNALIRKEILPQLKVLFGVRKGCAV